MTRLACLLLTLLFSLSGPVMGANGDFRHSSLAAKTGAGSIDNLVAAAQKAYPGKAGVTELHHITPKYLGGAVDGPLAPLDAAYHQQITNAFRDAWKYGQPKPSAEQLEVIMKRVYSQYPLP